MNTTARPLDPALMSAWLDQELDAATRAEVDAWLASHPEDVSHIHHWTRDGDLLRERMLPLLDEPVPEHLQALVLGSGRGAGAWRAPLNWRLAAGAGALLLTGGVIGAGLMWQLQRQEQLAKGPPVIEFVQRAAVAHAVYTIEGRHPVEVDTREGSVEEQRKNEEHLARWLTRRVGMPVKLFDLRAHGFALVGGRLLPELPHKSAQLMYENAAKQRITVYLRKPDADTPAAFSFERQGELSLFYWVDGPTGYALVGNLPREQLLKLAEDIYQQGPKVPAPAPAPAPAASGPRS
jgi:anti-sigma factor RsiW